MVEPVRYFANEMAREGNPVWRYRFAYVSEGEGLRNPVHA